MALREIGEKGETYDVSELSHQREFDLVWRSITPNDRLAIEAEINRRLDHLAGSKLGFDYKHVY
jgi:hypothetical protein